MEKEEAREKMHKIIDENFEEMWNRYTTIKNHIDKQGHDMITNLKKGDRFNAKRNFDNLNTIEKDLINLPEPLSHDLGILRSDLRNLCNYQRDRRHGLEKADKKFTSRKQIKLKPQGTRYGSNPIKY
jgi:archaellum component FlaC